MLIMVVMGAYKGEEEQVNCDREELELLLSKISAGVFIESEDYEIEYMNEFLIRIFGDQVGRKCYEVFAGKDKPCNPCPIDAIVEKGMDLFKCTVTYKNGRSYEVIAAPHHNSDGSRSVIEILRDVTEQQKLDQMKVDFVNVVAHEMRTPLAAVIGFDDLLSISSSDFTDKQKYYIESIKTNSHKLKQLIDDMLDLSYLDAGVLKLEYDSVRLYEIVNEVLVKNRSLIVEKNHEIDVNIPPSLIIQCDRQKIIRVMDNIVFNAVYYTDNNGNIRIDVDVRDDDLLVSVRDDGIGISDDDLPRIFDRFFMADASLTRHCDRIGIGLTLAKGYVELHGGEMWAASEIGKESVFYFTLPKYIKE